MKTILRILLPLLVLLLGYGSLKYLVSTKKEPSKRRGGFTTAPEVTATKLQATQYDVLLDTYGTVRPRTESTLLPEVSGLVLEISPNFREGGFFQKGDALLKIDPVDYETAVTIAKGNVAQAESNLAQEKARSEQARDTWKRLGKTGTPSALALRQPQMAEAEARLAASQAQLQQAMRELERTTITAPYAGRVLEQDVDLGQVVREGTPLGKIYAVDYAEIRLPLNNDQLAHLDLAENSAPDQDAPTVTLRAEVAGKPAEWEGRIVRVEGAIDERTRQLHVVAQVDDPYGREKERPTPLKVGLFVEAEIVGSTLENVIVLPRNTVRADGRVILLDSDQRVRLAQVDPILANEKSVILGLGSEAPVQPGDILCTTPMAYPAEGMQVRASIDGAAAPEAAGRGPGGPGGPGAGAGKGGPRAGKGGGRKPGGGSGAERGEGGQGPGGKRPNGGGGPPREGGEGKKPATAPAGGTP